MKPDTNPTDIGRNRTGTAVSPVHAREMEEAAAQVAPLGNPADFDAVRTEVSRTAPPIGTVPPPATLKGMAKTALKLIQGRDVATFIDKLAERLAFERTGVRLYEAVIATLPASNLERGTLTVEGIRGIRDEEFEHMNIARDAILALGADPTAMTPCADLAGVQGLGLIQSVSDPRVTLTQRLGALLIAELADNDGWDLLIRLAQDLGLEDLRARFVHALDQESRHLQLVRGWQRERLEVQLTGKAGTSPDQPQA